MALLVTTALAAGVGVFTAGLKKGIARKKEHQANKRAAHAAQATAATGILGATSTITS